MNNKLVIVIMCFAIFLSSCSIEIEDLEETDIYSRDYIMSIDQSLSMGFGKTDDETIALQYIYSNDELEKLYGSDFEVSDFGGNAELQSILWKTKGTSEYFFIIDNDEWIIRLSKGYNSKWKVVECKINVHENDLN